MNGQIDKARKEAMMEELKHYINGNINDRFSELEKKVLAASSKLEKKLLAASSELKEKLFAVKKAELPKKVTREKAIKE